LKHWVTGGKKTPGNYAVIVEFSVAPYAGLLFDSDAIKAEWRASNGWEVKDRTN
jgi:hypothetical protein